MSYYCELQILTPDCKPPLGITKFFCDPDIVHIDNKMNDNLMFNVSINELSLSDIIGVLRAIEHKLPSRVLVKYGSFYGTYIENKWISEIDYLPYIKPWQSYAIHLNKITLMQLIINRVENIREDLGQSFASLER